MLRVSRGEEQFQVSVRYLKRPWDALREPEGPGLGTVLNLLHAENGRMRSISAVARGSV